MEDLGRLLTMQDIAEITGLSRQAIWEARKTGKFAPEVKISQRRIVFPEKLFRDWFLAGGMAA